MDNTRKHPFINASVEIGPSSPKDFSLNTPSILKVGDHNINDHCQLEEPKWKVIVWGERGGQYDDAIGKVLTEGKVTAEYVDNLAALDTVKHFANSSIAVVAIAGYSEVDASSLEAIHHLSNAGFTIISHANRVRAWPLKTQCASLVAGASYLLDSERSDFSAELEKLIRRLLEKKSAQSSHEQQTRDFMNSQGIVGQSQQMVSIFRQIVRIGPLSDLPVLITGESGTGKELVARAIHRLDPKRCNEPFIALNCGAISSGLAESELFGHKKGTFTGANHDRKGLFRAANSGVIFLDEVGELNLDLQVKLLRVLQEKRVLGVGHDEEINVNSRTIAATNCNFDQMIDRKEFRVDLYHRLNVLSLHIPPLRERPEDIKPLIEHFLIKNCSLTDKGIPPVGQDFVDAISCLPLTGNARELENIVRRSLLGKQDGSPLCLSDFPSEIWRQLCKRETQCDPGQMQCPLENTSIFEPALSDCDSYLKCLIDMESNGWDLSQSVDDFERQLVQAALQKTRGNQTRAAQLLGITPRSVYNKLKKYQLGNRE
jgi:DNA-binding NtrC family response regulator